MKKIGQNIVIFLIILGVTYLQPVFFPFSQEKVEQAPVTPQLPQQPAPKVLKKEGLACYIGQSLSKLQHQLGEYQKVYQLDDGKWYQFEKEGSFVQAAVRNNKIEAILVMGEDAPVSPFKINMTSESLASDIEMITNFTISDHKKEYKVEVPEEELMASPFIEYEDGVYSFLQFNHQGQLKGIFYGDSTLFLKNMPYRLIKGTLPNAWIQNKKVLSSNESITKETLAYLIGNVSFEQQLDKKADEALKHFKEHLLDYVSEQEASIYEKAFTGEIRPNETLFLSQKVLEELLPNHYSMMMATGKDNNVALFHHFYERVGQEENPNSNYKIGSAYLGDVQLFIIDEVKNDL